MRRHLFAVTVGCSVLILDSPIASSATQPTGFCAELKSVVAAAGNGFAALRGPSPFERQGSRVQFFTVDRPLPGADKCDIRVHSTSAYFSCEWNIADEAELDQQFLRFAGSVQQCLPDASVFAAPERPSSFEPGEIRPATARFSYGDHVVITVRKYTGATSTTRGAQVYFQIRSSR